MAEYKPARAAEGMDVFVWRGAAEDTPGPLIVDFRPLTAGVAKGVPLEGALDPAGTKWYVLTDQDGVPTGTRDRLVTIRERVYQVRPKGPGETWLYMGRA